MPILLIGNNIFLCFTCKTQSYLCQPYQDNIGLSKAEDRKDNGNLDPL